MTANLENIHEKYNVFLQKNRMHADIFNLFRRFLLSWTLCRLKIEKQQDVSASLIIVLLYLFPMSVRFMGIVREENTEEKYHVHFFIIDDTTLEKTGSCMERGGIARKGDSLFCCKKGKSEALRLLQLRYNIFVTRKQKLIKRKKIVL